jgi:predicted transcriptional regulator
MAHFNHDKVSFILFVNNDVEFLYNDIKTSIHRLETYTESELTAVDHRTFEKLRKLNIIHPKLRTLLLFLLMYVDNELCSTVINASDIEKESNLVDMCPHKAHSFIQLMKQIIDEWIQNESKNINMLLQNIEDAYIVA